MNYLPQTLAALADSTPQPTPAPSETSLLPRAWAAELQRRLLRAYGDRLANVLTDQHTCEEWIETWRETLGGYSAEEIKRGLDEVERRVKRSARDGRTEWPMSPIEFAAVCRPQTHAAHTPFERTVPALRYRSVVAADCMDRIRAILKTRTQT